MPELLLAQTEQQNGMALSIKEPFSLEFLDLRPDAFTETDLENALITHLQEFLLELGKGFCFEFDTKVQHFHESARGKSENLHLW